MGNVILHVTMSLDGFMAGPNISTTQPMGEGGLRLHEWVFNTSTSDIDAQVVKELFATTGAVVLGRRTFDVGIEVWQDTPFPVPCFVLTHNPRQPLVMASGAFTFVDRGLNAALEQARAAAGDKQINLMGADIAQQFLQAGLLDEIHLQIAPVLMGRGRRLFEHLGSAAIELERLQVIESPYVTHMQFRVQKSLRCPET